MVSMLLTLVDIWFSYNNKMWEGEKKALVDGRTRAYMSLEDAFKICSRLRG